VSLKTWSRRTVGLFWVAGLVLETSVVIAGIVHARRDSAQADAKWEQMQGPTFKRGMPLTAEGLRRLDSAGVKLELHGDTIVSVTLSPEAARVFQGLGGAVRRVATGLAPKFALVFVLNIVLYLAVPGALLALTLAWLHAQRREDDEQAA
jgi:hypothetical protein